MNWLLYRTQRTLYNMPNSPIHTYSYKHFLCLSAFYSALQIVDNLLCLLSYSDPKVNFECRCVTVDRLHTSVSVKCHIYI